MANTKNSGKISKLWNLEKRLGIPIWHNSLVIPSSSCSYTPSEIKLQQQFNFIFIRTGSVQKESCQIFISDQTDLEALWQYLPYISERYYCFLCNDQLITERLSFLQQSNSLSTDNEVTKQLLALLEKAAQYNASDIHLESLPHKKSIRLRIDGNLKQEHFNHDIGDLLFSKIKLISSMDIAQKRKPQDGHFPFTSEQGKRFDMRTSSIPGVYGEKIVVRLLPASTITFSMSELGFSQNHIPIIKKQISKKTGLILFTGPTGSGKTTSLYAILSELASESVNIVTIEDPVEYRLNSVTQVEVNPLAGVTFSSALRAFLRQDPDVILVGEIRDQETAKIAARSAQTGHLVLSTLHSNSSFETIRRLRNLGVENDDIASSLSLVVSQRLAQRLCQCGFDPSCNQCSGRGINGRIPLMEVLEITPILRKMISKGELITSLQEQAKTDHHRSLEDVGKHLVDTSQISSKELEAICSL